MIGELTVCVRVSECGTVCAVQSTYFFVCLANATESSGTITRYGLPWLRLCTHCRWVRTHSYLISFPPSSTHPPPSLVARRQLVTVGPPPHTWQINSVIFFLRIIFFAPHFFVDIYIICYWISGINKLIASEVLIALFFLSFINRVCHFTNLLSWLAVSHRITTSSYNWACSPTKNRGRNR